MKEPPMKTPEGEIEFIGHGNVDDVPGIRVCEINLTREADVRFGFERKVIALMEKEPELVRIIASALEAMATQLRAKYDKEPVQ
jgi:hypothetical protein